MTQWFVYYEAERYELLTACPVGSLHEFDSKEGAHAFLLSLPADAMNVHLIEGKNMLSQVKPGALVTRM